MSCPTVGVWYYRLTDTDELKYSIRSAVKNLGIKKVILIGDKPKWFVESEQAIYIPSVPVRNSNYSVACAAWQHLEKFVFSGVYSGEFLLFNDDFFVLKPIKDWKDYHRDPSNYVERVQTSNRIYHQRELRALYSLNKTDGVHYNLHIPMKMDTEKLKETIIFWQGLLNKDIALKTTYGNMHLKDTEPMVDVKYHPNELFFSTGDRWWRLNGDSIREMFKEQTFVERHN